MNKDVVAIRLIAFFLLTLSVIIANNWQIPSVEFTKNDPFWLGSSAMCLAYLAKYIGNEPDNYDLTHGAMTFFILTKVIAQATHGNHYENAWGLLKSSH